MSFYMDIQKNAARIGIIVFTFGKIFTGRLWVSLGPKSMEEYFAILYGDWRSPHVTSRDGNSPEVSLCSETRSQFK
jgi:hypothetical protein